MTGTEAMGAEAIGADAIGADAIGTVASPRPAYLLGSHYLLGEIDADHSTIADLTERAAKYQLAPKAQLWGWGRIRRTEQRLEDLAVGSALGSLRAAGVPADTVDALVLCTTSVSGPADDHGRFFEAVLTGIGLGDIAFYGLTMNRCTNLLAGIDLAAALVGVGRYRRVLVVTTDLVTDEAERMASYALFSDGAASCLVTDSVGDARPDSVGDASPGSSDSSGSSVGDPAGCYQIIGSANAQQARSLEWTNEISSDLARQTNDKLLGPAGLQLAEICTLMHLNIFTPLAVMKERQAGFRADQLFTANIERTGHCFAADPLINLVDRAAAGAVHPEHHYLLAASVPGSRFAVLLRRLAG